MTEINVQKFENIYYSKQRTKLLRKKTKHILIEPGNKMYGHYFCMYVCTYVRMFGEKKFNIRLIMDETVKKPSVVLFVWNNANGINFNSTIKGT